MSTDFFTRQDQAKQKTGRLLFCLFAGLAVLIGTTYALIMFIWNTVGQGKGHDRLAEFAHEPQWWNAGVFLLVAVFTSLVVLGASTVRTMQLKSGGGAAVAEGLGGREITQGSHDPDERKMLNVVEEMAIAASCPRPRIFVMDGEEGINAFAAGWTPDTAVIGVTRGAIANLSRDELQGVVAHEFSHIVHGDMRINIRLMGLVFGLLALVFIGRVLLEIGWWSRPSRDDKKGDPRAALALIGLVLLVMGWLGALFGQVMQAAISRQREFLADASAVQYTRNPQGLANALKRIGAVGCEVSGARAKEASHMFFGGVGSSLFATHPPLEERIRRLDPAWDGSAAPPRQAPSRSERAGAGMRDAPRQAPLGAAGGRTPATLREWAAACIAGGPLAAGGEGVPLDVCADEAAFALSILARCAGRSEEKVRESFAAGAARLALPGVRLAEAQECRLTRLDEAMDALAAVSADGRRQFLAACQAAAGADGQATPMEAQVFAAYRTAMGPA